MSTETSTSSAPETITAANAETLPTVTVFSKNDCPICVNTKAKFTERGVPFTEINVEEDTAPRAEFGNKTPLEHVMGRYGRQMPVVVVENGIWDDHWLGSRPDKIVELVGLFKKLGALVRAE